MIIPAMEPSDRPRVTEGGTVVSSMVGKAVVGISSVVGKAVSSVVFCFFSGG